MVFASEVIEEGHVLNGICPFGPVWIKIAHSNVLKVDQKCKTIICSSNVFKLQRYAYDHMLHMPSLA